MLVNLYTINMLQSQVMRYPRKNYADKADKKAEDELKQAGEELKKAEIVFGLVEKEYTHTLSFSQVETRASFLLIFMGSAFATVLFLWDWEMIRYGTTLLSVCGLFYLMSIVCAILAIADRRGNRRFYPQRLFLMSVENGLNNESIHSLKERVAVVLIRCIVANMAVNKRKNIYFTLASLFLSVSLCLFGIGLYYFSSLQ